MAATIQARPLRRLLTTTIFLCLCALARAAAPEPFADGGRVLFLGDSITRAGGWHSQIALFYETRFPGRRITWLNAGISGDTSAGALQRLQWDVLERKPSTVVIMLGMNDAARDDLPSELGMGEIGSAKRIAEYAKNIRILIEKLQEAKVCIILCTPSPYDATVKVAAASHPAANHALTQMAAICRELAVEFDLPLVDFNRPMNAIAAAYQKTNPNFTLIGGDRVHPGAMGNTLMAHLFLKTQGLSGRISSIVIDAEKAIVKTVENGTVTDFQVRNHAVSFTLTEDALPMPFDGKARQALRLSPENELLTAMARMKRPADAHTRMGAGLAAAESGVGVEFDQANNTAWDEIFWRDQLHRQMLTVTGLPNGEYELLIDDQPVGRFWTDELAAGVNLSGLRAMPQYQQAEKVAAVHARRHQAASFGPRMLAFTRRFTLTPAKVDASDQAAVTAFLGKLISDPTAKDRIELGGYALAMAKKYQQLKPAEAKTAADIAAADDQIEQLNKPLPHRYVLRPVMPPLSPEARQKAFAARHDPEQVEAVAKDFLDQLVLDHAGLLRTNLRHRAGLIKVADLVKAGKPVAALDAYRDYFFDKLRNASAYGLPEKLINAYNGIINLKEQDQTLARAEELLLGKILADGVPMQPGCVWLPRPKEAPNGAANPWKPKTFQPLAAAYLITGEQRYLDQWVAYLEDWALFENTDAAIRATDISDSDCHVSEIVAVYQVLGGIARLQPAAQANFPPDSLARILSKLIRVNLPLSVVYHDSNPQNWTPKHSVMQMQVAALIDEFAAAEYFFARGRHRSENYGTIQNLPDGSETEHALWYNAHYFDGAIEAIELITDRRTVQSWKRPWWEAPAMDANWEHAQREKIIDRVRYFLHMLTLQWQYPLGNRCDRRTLPDWKSTVLVEYAIVNGTPDLSVLLNNLRGNTSAGLPSFTMSAFPYSGSWIMRNGWSKDDGYAHFFCSPYPVGGHAFRGLKSNNGFWLSEAGQDLLVTGGFGSYSYDRSPLRVDGKEQFALAGIGNPGINKNHKGFGVAFIDPQPPAWRSHSSENFDFSEGLYNGPYGDFVEDHHDNKDYRAGFLAERARQVITGVSHHRQVFHIKNPQLWIVVDRVRSLQPHQYTLDWYMPAPLLPEDKTRIRDKPKTFADDTIRIDQVAQTLTSSAEDMPNLRIQYFGPRLTLNKTAERGECLKNDFTYRYKLYDFWRLSGSWQSQGDDVVISLIEAIAEGGVSQVATTQKTVSGFTATLTDGKKLRFTAAADDSSTLSLGDRGLVLGKQSYEFHRKSWLKTTKQAIYTPIAPVSIEPKRTLIMEDELVTLSCATPDVDIRYTLDGSEPSIHSPLYIAPLTFNNSATVKARAFRPGLAQTPVNLAGTHATVTGVARFKRAEPIQAVAAPDGKGYQPGLKAEYREGDWKDLAFFPETVKPQKTMNVRHLFDRCQPNSETVFGWTYSGFLTIPEDGVYTFHAPEEMITSPQEPGYNLRLFVGQEIMPNNQPSGRLNEWYPATTRHAYGTWSIALKKGLHPFEMRYVDYRADAAERLNHPGMRLNTIWEGAVPEILVSGPGMERQPISKEWFKYQQHPNDENKNGAESKQAQEDMQN
jgi:lysophospholipase L1-like esterase